MSKETTEATTVVVNPPSGESPNLSESLAVEVGRLLESNQQLIQTNLELSRRLETMEQTQMSDRERLNQVYAAIEQAKREAVATSVTAAAVMDEAEVESESDAQVEAVTPEPEPEAPAEPETPKAQPPWIIRKLLGE